MSQDGQLSPFFSLNVPMWSPGHLPAFIRGLKLKEDGAVTFKPSKGTLTSIGPSMNAFASIIIPADPDVPGDKPAGALAPASGQPTKSFHEHMILIIQTRNVPAIGVRVTTDDALAVIAELDAHADKDFNRATFAQLTNAQQQGLVNALLGGTLTALTVKGKPQDASLVLQSLGRLLVVIVKIAYWTNYPEHRVRDTPLGWGPGPLLFSDPANLITSPNDINTVTGFDYLGWHFPLRKGVEDKYGLAFIEADVPANAADSEDALAELLAKDLARTLILDP
ncbi:gluconate 2-dehydrogenase subunit 3 family protein [Polyangium jinanense]|uniref:Uncharacterized protein n=1 Tax=Polyangium jinanense TaxID=2829994 RepID=A0A9X4AUL3_9BACT|nr:gluconate 2-dehydrogenase subunit 3 family protein [Polyangium jinanense]MDC3960526.1 hypothetical protein [Polyangium jinanense]MDC3985388.1 hypothetical protein [Polyangium jinanense]